MVWGCISYEGLGPLIRCSDHMNQEEYKVQGIFCFQTFPEIKILSSMLQAFPRLRSRATNHPIFQHDNAACHTAGGVETFLRAKNVTLLPWPALSPDLSPIENVWGHIAKKMVGKCFLSKDDVWAEVQKQWAEVPLAYIHSLYDSMPSRLLAVQQAKGHPPKYQVLPNLTVV